jgi:hypothetical protein
VSAPDQPLRDWDDLDSDQQIALQVEFGHWLDALPPTCSLDAKVARFREWLRERGIQYRG